MNAINVGSETNLIISGHFHSIQTLLKRFINYSDKKKRLKTGINIY